MISSNMKRALLVATVALGAAFAGPAMSQPPESEALYNYYYFNENNEQTGYDSDYCSAWGINRAVPPTGTYRVVTEIYAYCRGGQLTLE